MRIFALALLLPLLGQVPAPVIVDTDAGSDDLIALLWLLRQAEIKIEAVTVVQGLAHPAAGAESVLRLLEAAGMGQVPVYVGADRPVQGHGAFPADWRSAADRLLRDEFPAPRRKPEARPAAQYLAERLMDVRRPVRVLALGPLTNVAQAMAVEPRTAATPHELIWMGGALDVPGNVPEAPTAEWNAWVDPEAAERVLASGWQVRIVPLDATSRVPVGPPVLQLFEQEAREWAATAVLRLLRSEREAIQSGRYFAWDVLAAMALTDMKLTTQRMVAVAVRKRPRERGRLVRVEGARPNAWVAVTADPGRFLQHFRTILP
jgi:inosine-uridine nucleoside N-ribohydrolase